MKAKDYAARFRGVTDNDRRNAVANQVARDFVLEIERIGQMRHARRDNAVMAILHEQDAKWCALARIVPDLRTDGFQEAVRIFMPPIYEAWTGRPADSV